MIVIFRAIIELKARPCDDGRQQFITSGIDIMSDTTRRGIRILTCLPEPLQTITSILIGGAFLTVHEAE